MTVDILGQLGEMQNSEFNSVCQIIILIFSAHSNFYNINFMTVIERESLLESIETMYKIINNNCDISAVGQELKTLNSITLRSDQGTFRIGNESFQYNNVAF